MLATRPDQRPHYERMLANVPSHCLLRELERREVGLTAGPPVLPVLRLPGLSVDRTRLTATWRGAQEKLTPTELTVLVALVHRHPEPTSGLALGTMGWPGFEVEDAGLRARVYVHRLRGKLPGLIASGKDVGYWLDLGAAS